MVLREKIHYLDLLVHDVAKSNKTGLVLVVEELDAEPSDAHSLRVFKWFCSVGVVQVAVVLCRCNHSGPYQFGYHHLAKLRPWLRLKLKVEALLVVHRIRIGRRTATVFEVNVVSVWTHEESHHVSPLSRTKVKYACQLVKHVDFAVDSVTEVCVG